MKKLVLIFIFVAHAAFSHTNSWDSITNNCEKLTNIWDSFTNSWEKLTYDSNSTAVRIMCMNCTIICQLPLGKVVKVGRSQIKCPCCNHIMWYVDEWMLLNFCHTQTRNMAVIAFNELNKVMAHGDLKKVEEWLSKFEMAMDRMVKVQIDKQRYLARKKKMYLARKKSCGSTVDVMRPLSYLDRCGMSMIPPPNSITKKSKPTVGSIQNPRWSNYKDSDWRKNGKFRPKQTLELNFYKKKKM